MKKFFMTALVCLSFALAANAQLLYKISGKDLKQPSYIIGTHHLANVAFIDKIAGVKEALNDVAQVYGEICWDDITNPDSMKIMQQTMMLPDGKTLKDVLSKAQYDKLNGYLKNTMGVGLDHPQVAAQMGSMSPMALLTQLQVLTFVMKHMGEFDPSSTFDQYFQAQAKKNNMHIGGLETLSFQSNLLYRSATMERQIEQLLAFIDNTEKNAELMEKMTEAFYAQDIKALKTAMDTKMGNAGDSTPEENAALIDNRNARWAETMPAIMADKPTLFVVGAGHLPGDKGVLALLTNAGYTIEAMK
ncbi:MAG: TraB/GumN family protein [Prevotella sp.]